MVLTKKFRNIGLHDRLTLVERGTRRMRIAQALLAECSDRKIVSPIEAALGQPIPRCTVPGVEPWVERQKPPSRSRSRV